MVPFDCRGASRMSIALGLFAILIAGAVVHAAADDTRLPATIRFDPTGGRVASFERFVYQLFALELDAIDITVSGSRPARIAIVAAYAVVGETVEFTLSLVDERAGRTVGVIEGSARADLQLDRLLTQRFAALIDLSKDAIASIREDEALLADARRREADRLAAEAAAEASADDIADHAPSVAPSVPSAPSSARARATDFPRFEIAAGGAPIVPTGRASDYFGIGYSGVVRFAYRIPAGAGAFGVGLSITPIRFVRTEEELGAFFRYVIPVAVEARFSFAEGHRVEAFARLGVGASYRVPELSVSVDALSTVLPSGVGGAGLSVRVAPRTLIAVEVGSTVIVHLYQSPAGSIQTETVVAVVPSLQLSRRF